MLLNEVKERLLNPVISHKVAYIFPRWTDPVAPLSNKLNAQYALDRWGWHPFDLAAS